MSSIDSDPVWTETPEGPWESRYAGLYCVLHKYPKEYPTVFFEGFEDGNDAKLFAEACLKARIHMKGEPIAKVLQDAETVDRVSDFVVRCGEKDFEDFIASLRRARGKRHAGKEREAATDDVRGGAREEDQGQGHLEGQRG